jgi:hypothetical protein
MSGNKKITTEHGMTYGWSGRGVLLVQKDFARSKYKLMIYAAGSGNIWQRAAHAAKSNMKRAAEKVIYKAEVCAVRISSVGREVPHHNTDICQQVEFAKTHWHLRNEKPVKSLTRPDAGLW